MLTCFGGGVTGRLPYGHQGEDETDDRDHRADIGRCETQPVTAGEIPGHECRQRHREVSSEFVQSHREPTSLGTDEIDLHDDRRRPSKPLIQAQ